MSDLRAFKLIKGLEGSFRGASFAYGSMGATFDIGAALDDNDTIVTDDDSVAAGLLGSGVMEAIDVPEGAAPVAVEAPVGEQHPTPVDINSPAAQQHLTVPPAEHLDDELVPDDPEKAGELGSKPAI